MEDPDEQSGTGEAQQDHDQDNRIAREEVVGREERIAYAAHSDTSCTGSRGTVCLRTGSVEYWRSQRTNAPETASQKATSTSRNRSSPHQVMPMPSPPQNVPKLVSMM